MILYLKIRNCALLAAVFINVIYLSSASAMVACQASCPGSKFIVDLQARCMCLPSGECFKIDIGKSGPNMTTGGMGKTHEAKGAKYQTTGGPGSTGYDKDAIATGIQANDAVGKWIHKTRRCSQGGNTATKGCIGVPCDVWPLVKKQMGQNISICGSTNNGGGEHMSGHMSSESDDDEKSEGSK